MKSSRYLAVVASLGMWAGVGTALELPRGIDPTETLTRADVAVRYVRGDKKYFGTIMSTEYAVVPTAVLGLRVPFLNIDDPGKSDTTGFGDIALIGGWRVMESDAAAIRLDLEAIFDTSDDSVLGADTDMLVPAVKGSYFLHGQDAVVGAVLAHRFDVGSSGETISETELRPYYLQNLGWGSWFEVISHLYLDWEDGNEFGWFQEAKACQMLTDQIGIAADVGFRLAGDNRLVQDWALGMSARYLF